MCNVLKDGTVDVPYGWGHSIDAGDDEIPLAPDSMHYALFERQSSLCIRRREAGVMAEEGHSESALI